MAGLRPRVTAPTAGGPRAGEVCAQPPSRWQAFQALGQVQVLGNRLNISRARHGSKEAARESFAAPAVPKKPKMNKKAKKRAAAAAV